MPSPDAVAEKAIPLLEQDDVKAKLDGKVASLLASMDANGIERSVICSIATRPEQFRPILEWSRSIASPRLVPFASVHPDDPEATARLRAVREAGLLGVKLHPYYQKFEIDAPRMWPIYEAIQETGLILLCHCGFDPGFPRDRIADPVRIHNVMRAFPGLRFVAAHMGAWEDWAEVERLLLGTPIYTEISFFIDYVPRAEAIRFLRAHPSTHILFGTDSRWEDHAHAIQAVRELELGDALEARIFYQNARELLASAE